MKNVILILCISFTALCHNGYSQVKEIDLSEKSGISVDIEVGSDQVTLINASNKFEYSLQWKKTQIPSKPFETANFSSGDNNITACEAEIKNLIVALANEKNEGLIKSLVKQGEALVNRRPVDNCSKVLIETIGKTRRPVKIPFSVSYNQEISLIVIKIDSEGKEIEKWSYKLKTPEKSLWLIHYGLTYAPSAFSRVSKYYVSPDTTATNKYTIKKENKNGPKPWDNISATINFTYPFHGDSRDFDGGFTGGFGLSTGFEVSGHAGLSMIIGQNIILSGGVVMMQKHKLNGEYKEGDIVKTNLNFEALHTKVWVPELFFTVGFRFGSNPFAAKKANSEAKKEE